ncbi:MAG TPA: hypothetical protein VMF62_03445 [Acetobacteraceae bacterium]|nr:hypothetical protein [Acetobacteraceae bacterium]
MQITEPNMGRSVGEGSREGDLENKVLAEGREGSPNNYSFERHTALSDWSTPRHTHDFDQVRYFLEGEYIYGKNDKGPPGWVGFFPAGTYYGTQIRKKGSTVINCQFGAADGVGYASRRQRRAAADVLLGKGRFEGGIFTFVDEQGRRHNQDGSEAVTEQVFGRKVAYPAARYHQPILMNPDAFRWVEMAGSPGIATKWLGSFSEREARFGFLRVDPGATFQAGLHASPELLFLSEGSVRCRGRAYPRHSAFAFDALEGPVALEGVEPAILFRIHLPTF